MLLLPPRTRSVSLHCDFLTMARGVKFNSCVHVVGFLHQIIFFLLCVAQIEDRAGDSYLLEA